jgi:phospholipase D1/2
MELYVLLSFSSSHADFPLLQLAIMGMTYNSISRGGHSIMECIQREGFDPNDYISFYNLRSYDRLNADKDRLEGMSKRSGVDFDHAQAAFAR